jgi:hypothetical protein
MYCSSRRRRDCAFESAGALPSGVICYFEIASSLPPILFSSLRYTVPSGASSAGRLRRPGAAVQAARFAGMGGRIAWKGTGVYLRGHPTEQRGRVG